MCSEVSILGWVRVGRFCSEVSILLGGGGGGGGGGGEGTKVVQ